ncbi:MAG: hypothetical protein WB678_11270 [Stellaceae bacterium]
MTRTGGPERPQRFTMAELEPLRLAMKADLAELKCELLKWYIGPVIAQTAAIVALVKLMLGHA